MSTNASTINSTTLIRNGFDTSLLGDIKDLSQRIYYSSQSFMSIVSEYENRLLNMSASEKMQMNLHLTNIMIRLVKPMSEKLINAMDCQIYHIDVDIMRKVEEEEEDKKYESYFEEVFPDDIYPAKNKVRVRGRRQANNSPSGNPKLKRRPRRHKDDEKMKQHKSKVSISKARLVRGTEPESNHFDTSSALRENDNSHLVNATCILCLDTILYVPEWDTEMAVCNACCVKFSNEAKSRIQGVKDKLDVLQDAFSNCEAYLKRGYKEDRIYTSIEMNNIGEEIAHYKVLVIRYFIGEEIAHYQDTVKLYNKIINPRPVVII